MKQPLKGMEETIGLFALFGRSTGDALQQLARPAHSPTLLAINLAISKWDPEISVHHGVTPLQARTELATLRFLTGRTELGRVPRSTA